MIKTFCDCCGKEIPNSVTLNSTVFRNKKVGIDTDHKKVCGGYIEEFHVELIMTANIYKPVNQNDEMTLIGHNICNNCIVETLTQVRG
jgi:hypothetical protein